MKNKHKGIERGERTRNLPQNRKFDIFIRRGLENSFRTIGRNEGESNKESGKRVVKWKRPGAIPSVILTTVNYPEDSMANSHWEWSAKGKGFSPEIDRGSGNRKANVDPPSRIKYPLRTGTLIIVLESSDNGLIRKM
ncbi:hypothetical protein TNIN_407651 [Trichonephila inaurata madagascariensis]|uniref:Uncharacterized protein n=1 Tax=Trichonephila inaurata madagascariensis TaxID=2747483 RepID=A0A8X6XK63_9ARAC|nr:hypothetical protein TNIN_407651 [Trichonephila inaurata madagascariensis]